MPQPVVTAQTENDALMAAEADFVAQFATKDGPVTIPKAAAKTEPTAPAGDPPTPPEPVAAADAAPSDPAVPNPTEGQRLKDPTAPAEGTPAEGEEVEVEGVTDEAFQAAMAAERAPLSLDGIPEAARPIVQKKIKDLESGWHRQMQKLAADRKAVADIKAEERFRTERPADFITTMLLADPGLMEQVNAHLEEFEKSPKSREAHAIIVQNERTKAKDAEHAALEAEKARTKRAEEVTKIGKAAAKAAGVPFEAGVEAHIAAHLAINGEISEADVRRIAAEQAAVWKRSLRAVERDKSTQYVASKVKDRKTAGLAVRPTTGTAPTPTALPTPTNEDEFIAQFVQKGG